MSKLTKRIIATIGAVAMVIALSPANDVFADGADDFKANGFAYGSEMDGTYTSSNIILNADLLDNAATFVGKDHLFQYKLLTSDAQDGEYTQVGGNHSSGSFEFTPTNGNWYKIEVVNDDLISASTEAVQALYAKSENSEGYHGTLGDDDFYGCQIDSGWYLSNGTMAYRVWSEGEIYYGFNVMGKYDNDGEDIWIGTSYDGRWSILSNSEEPEPYSEQDKSGWAQLNALRFGFDSPDNSSYNSQYVDISVELKEGQTSFAIKADTMLANEYITDYADNASLREKNDNNGNATQVQMVGNESAAKANASDPAFVIRYDNKGTDHLPDYDWIGSYCEESLYYSNNETEEYDPEEYECDYEGQYLFNSRYGKVTEVRNLDSEMAATWINVEDGEEINFSFSIGSVGTTKADTSRSALDGDPEPEEEPATPSTVNEAIAKTEDLINEDGTIADLVIEDWSGCGELDTIEEFCEELKADQDVVSKICTDYMNPDAKIVAQSGEGHGLYTTGDGDSTLMFAYQYDDGTLIESEVKYTVKSNTGAVPEMDMTIMDKLDFGKDGIKIKDWQEVTVIKYDYKDTTNFFGTMRIEKKENLKKYFAIGYKADGTTVIVPCWEDEYYLTFEIASDIVQIALVGTQKSHFVNEK